MSGSARRGLTRIVAASVGCFVSRAWHAFQQGLEAPVAAAQLVAWNRDSSVNLLAVKNA